MHWQGAGENNRAQRNRESVFPSARPESAGSGECDALAASAVGGGCGRVCCSWSSAGRAVGISCVGLMCDIIFLWKVLWKP